MGLKSLSTAIVLLAVGLVACQQRNQNTYNYDEVGKSAAVSFGTVLAVRQVDVIGKNTGVGMLAGGAVGGGAGSYAGSGSGQAWAVGAGILAGAVAGGLAEQAAQNRKGIEYTLAMETGATMTVVQEIAPTDRQF